MDYKLKLPVTIDPESVKDITDKMLVDIYMLRISPFPARCEVSKLNIEAVNNLKASNLYFYTNTCMVGKKNVEYKTQSGENITNYSLYFLN